MEVKILSVSEKKKASNAKWDSANMATVGCRLRKEQAEAFREYCKVQGMTSNTALKNYVLECLKAKRCVPSQQPVGAPVKAANPLEGILSTDTLRAAQKAAKATGEDMPTFMARAVDRTVKVDEATWSLGLNPATGEDVTKGGKTDE